MKKTGTDISLNKARARMVAQQKKEAAVEAGLQARKTRITKAIAIGSAALGILTLGLAAANKWKKKKKGLFS